MMDSCIRGFYIYKEIWNPTEELLTCRREPGNVHDPYAVAMMNGEDVVGHVPQVILVSLARSNPRERVWLHTLHLLVSKAILIVM